jgi:hypothetical protein
MRRNAVPMSEESYRNVADLLRGHGIKVEESRRINEFMVARCLRDDVAVLLSVSKPAHWATASDERRDMVVVAAIAESALRFWRIPRENRLRREIIELLRPLEWRPR